MAMVRLEAVAHALLSVIRSGHTAGCDLGCGWRQVDQVIRLARCWVSATVADSVDDHLVR